MRSNSQSCKNSYDFIKGPLPLLRDDPINLNRGFVVQDKNYLSALWPGDAHMFGNKSLDLMKCAFEIQTEESRCQRRHF